jgi:hypothetical protein
VTERASREYTDVVRLWYQQADKRERGRILDAYCRAIGCHRKAAVPRGLPVPGGFRPRTAFMSLTL